MPIESTPCPFGRPLRKQRSVGMEKLESDARRRVGRQEQVGWLELNDAFVRELQALHHAIITRAERQHASAMRAAEDAERDYLADRAKALQKAFMDTMGDPVFLAEARKIKLDLASR